MYNAFKFYLFASNGLRTEKKRIYTYQTFEIHFVLHIERTSDKLMSLWGPKLTSTHPKIKDKEGLVVMKRINITLIINLSKFNTWRVHCTVTN